MKVTQQQVMDEVQRSTYTILPDGITTICQITMKNGYTVIGKSACADPDEFNKSEGEKWAWTDALRQIWPLLGYVLKSELSGDRVARIAKVCHEANRAYCYSLGDRSQPAWEAAPEWQRESARAGVIFHMTGDHGPEASHESWMAQKKAEGWTYGPVKNPERKEHPCMLPYIGLPLQQVSKDHIFRGIVHAMRAL